MGFIEDDFVKNYGERRVESYVEDATRERREKPRMSDIERSVDKVVGPYLPGTRVIEDRIPTKHTNS
jgi:hypothetical protein